MANDALQANPVNANYNITTQGSDWLWAVFAVMLFTDIGFLVWTWMLPKGRRTFHYLSIFILTTASIAYFSLASDLGATPVEVEFRGVPRTRQIWYARYIDWFITTPALLLEIALATALPLSDIMALIFFDLVMIVTGLIGALVVSSYKWGYFGFGCAALIYIWWVLLGPGLKSMKVLGPEYRKAYIISSAYLSFMWLLYPICWGLADGGNVITPDSEMIFYGILDVLAKPVFAIIHVLGVYKLDYSKLFLQSGKLSEGEYAFNPTGFNGHNHVAQQNGLLEKNARADDTAAGAHTTGAAPAINPRTSEATAVNA